MTARPLYAALHRLGLLQALAFLALIPICFGLAAVYPLGFKQPPRDVDGWQEPWLFGRWLESVQFLPGADSEWPIPFSRATRLSPSGP